MKRTRKLALTGLMAMGGVSLTACGDQPSVTIADQGKSVDAYAYQSLQECKDKNEVPDDACDTGMKKARDEEASEAKYADNKDALVTLTTKVVKGGGGVWGAIPMPANPQVTEAEAKVLVQWILSLK